MPRYLRPQLFCLAAVAGLACLPAQAEDSWPTFDQGKLLATGGVSHKNTHKTGLLGKGYWTFDISAR